MISILAPTRWYCKDFGVSNIYVALKMVEILEFRIMLYSAQICKIVKKMLMLCGRQPEITFDVDAFWTWLLRGNQYFGNTVDSMY